MDHHTSSTSHNSDGWEYDCGFNTGMTAQSPRVSHTPQVPPTPQRPPRAQTRHSTLSHEWGSFNSQYPLFQPTNPWSNGTTFNSPPTHFVPPPPPAATSTPSPPSPASIPSLEPCDEDGYFSYEPRTLRTRLSENDREYLSVKDVFHHVTLGGRLSTTGLMELGVVIKRAVFGEEPPYDKVPIVKRDIMIGSHQIMIIPYKWTDYPKMAQACLQFALDHPDYIAR